MLTNHMQKKKVDNLKETDKFSQTHNLLKLNHG